MLFFIADYGEVTFLEAILSNALHGNIFYTKTYIVSHVMAH